MQSKFTPSVNIIRDSNKSLNYIVTENAQNSALKLLNDYSKGFHSFSIIGSYGTGKSSFLWAFEQSLTRKNELFDFNLPSGIKNVKVINCVGSYQSIIEYFNEYFDVKKDYSNNQKLFNAIFESYQSIGNDGLLVLVIDEFGKFLEFAANNNPEKEMYFIQQLAEFINDPARNIMLITSLHQGIDAYAAILSNSQKNEWRKVKGRIQEITFNEPVEQLLSLAASHFVEQFGETKSTKYSESLIVIQEKTRIYNVTNSYFEKLDNSLYPLDVFSAYTLTLGLQKYGQNERSLFSFLQASDELGINDTNRKNSSFSIASVYDYLLTNYYHLLNSKANVDYSNWNSIKDTLQRIETIDTKDVTLAEEIIKTIGLLHITATKAAKIGDEFLIGYLLNSYSKDSIKTTIDILVKRQLIRYSNFDFSYKLFKGTDLDIEGALIQAENQLSDELDLVPKLTSYFNFPIVTAKAASYKTGTPRLFEYEISDKPIHKTPTGEIDGFINLIFNTKLKVKNIHSLTSESSNAILHVFFKNTDKIKSAIYDIEKTNQVLANIKDSGDRVALKSLEEIRLQNTILLNHYVLDGLFKESDVAWVYKGKSIRIGNKRELNQQLSRICEDVYSQTPVIKNELFNKHKVSGAIATARRSFFRALEHNFDLKDLGFSNDKFPPEKTIYYTLLQRQGIHIETANGYTLTSPKKDSEIYVLWEICEQFLSTAKDERKNISELIDTLSNAPYKVKQGVIDFWVPIFLFIRKGDYALYSNGTFKPYINEQELHLLIRNPHIYEVKSFELNDLKLSFFNKYRELLQLENSDKANINTFIESIRPVLLMIRNLTPYSQTTKRISKEAFQLRESIQTAQDPEKVFFDEFPKALGFDTNELLQSKENFDNYIYKFQNTLDEIKDSYNQLLNRFEQFIVSDVIGKKCEFETYKNALSNRFSSLKEHQLIAKQKTFVQRVNSPLNDRDSWLASVAQTLIGKTLTSITDTDENVLKDNFKHLVKELDNLSVIEKLNVNTATEEVFKLDFTTKKEGLIPHLVRIPKSKLEKAENQMISIKNDLGTDKQMRIAILAKLLKDELNNE
tara:strand:- start:32233 stop:35457 length:3225 start_codon:yes stop_codon:yes gene_type:complete